MLVGLLIFCLLLLALLLWIHKNDFMSPDVLLCLVYSISIIFALYNREIWQLDDYSFKSTFILGIPMMCFAIVGVVEEVHWRNAGKRKEASFFKLQEISITPFVNLINCLLCLSALLLTIRSNGDSLVNLVNAFGVSNITSATVSYEGTSSILSILNKYTDIAVYFFAFVFMNNWVHRGFKTRDLPIIISTISVVLKGMLSGTRITLLHVVACLGFTLYFLSNKNTGWKKRYNVKFIVYIIVGLSVLLTFFYQIRDYRGTTTNMDFMYYISMYTSAPIKLLDMFVKDPISSDIWGKETFRNLNYNLSIFGNDNLHYARHLEFRYIGGINLGNVYGAPRRYFSDFGFLGLIVLSAILAFVICRMYYKNKYYSTNGTTFSLVTLSYFYFSIPMFIIDDVFFSEISIGFVLNLLLLYLLYYFLIERKKVIKFGAISLT